MRGGGIRALWFTALGELCYRRVEIREFPLDEAGEKDHDAADFAIELLDATHIEQYKAFRRPSDPDSAQRRMRAGHRCFVARHEGKIVCASWGATENARSGYLSRPIALSADEAYAYDLFTAPEWRQKGAATALTSALHKFYQAEGKWRVLRAIVPENFAAITGTLGYYSIGRMGFLGIGKIRLNFCRMNAGRLAPGKSRHPNTK